MATTEHSINDALAALLRGTRWAWRGDAVVRSETTGLLAESKLRRPDILVLEPYTSPVVIETEVVPAADVEAEALARLGEKLSGSGRPVLSCIAVRLPQRFREVQGRKLKNAIKHAGDLDFALYSGKNAQKFERYPQSGWLSGSINELSLFVQSASMPPLIIEDAADTFEMGVNQAASFLNDIAKDHPATVQKIANELHQQDSTQTRRMAMVILVNAFIFHEYLAGGNGGLAGVRTLAELKYSNAGLQISVILEDWNKILRVDYFPIFDIACRILRVIPSSLSQELVGRLARTAEKLVSTDVIRSHDLTGTVFQKLISDRKFLAAFYTTPASAALLAGLAINEDTLLSNGDWSNPVAVASMRIADFACGTGTLLTTAYQRIIQIHELRGGNAEAIHPQMMARALVGCDILPAAAHLTASALAGSYPHVQYDESAIFTAPYGVQTNDEVKLGSIDLLRHGKMLEGLKITAKAIEATQDADVDIWRYAPHGSFDMVIMNPPFTRPTNHAGSHANVPNPVFAAFGSTAQEQKLMKDTAKELTKGTIYHGNAGVASVFLELADRKLKVGGTLAMVMPMTLLTGTSWQKCRNRLYEAYENLIVVTIAGSRNYTTAFSADTGIADCLIIGQRSDRRKTHATFVILNKPPEYSAHAAAIATQVQKLSNDNAIRRLDDRPVGGTQITIGNEIVGQVMYAPLPKNGSWKVLRVVDLSLAQSAYQLATRQRVWLPTQESPLEITINTVQRIGKLGPISRDINGTNPDGSIRGPFELQQLHANMEPTYPVLHAHKAERERTLMFEADCEGIPRLVSSELEQEGIYEKTIQVFQTASHCHHNVDFRFNAQSTSMQFTQRKTIGGRAWLSVKLSTPELEKALVLWANSTLGLMMYWWHASKQDAGRGSIPKSSLKNLPVLDVTALSQEQLIRGGGVRRTQASAAQTPAPARAGQKPQTARPPLLRRSAGLARGAARRGRSAGYPAPKAQPRAVYPRQQAIAPSPAAKMREGLT